MSTQRTLRLLQSSSRQGRASESLLHHHESTGKKNMNDLRYDANERSRECIFQRRLYNSMLYINKAIIIVC